MISRRTLLAGAVFSAAGCRPAATAVPPDGVIRKSGSWYVPSHRAADKLFNIRILADDVDLDLNGSTLSHARPLEANYGIIADRTSNVVIRDGKITNHSMGVAARDSKNLVVDNVDFTGCHANGISSQRAIGMRVRNSTFQTIAGWKENPYAIGIKYVGRSAVIENCAFRELYRQPGIPGVGEGVAIIVSRGSSDVTIKNNRFENVYIKGEVNIAVWIASGCTGVAASENDVVNFGRGFISASANPCTIANNRLRMRSREPRSNAIHAPSGAVVQNVVMGYATAISGNAYLRANVVYP
jgi:Right handed beta helix region